MAGTAGCRPRRRCRGGAFRDRRADATRSCCRREPALARQRPVRSSACPGSCAAPATPTTATSSEANADGRPLHAADHARPPPHRHARAACSRWRARYPGPAAHRARRAGDPRAVRRARPRGRRRVPEGRAPLPRPRPAQRRRRASARQARARARGDPGRRRLQHAAAPDALRHRPARGAGARTASRCGSTCRASAATCRTATRSASSTACASTHWEALAGARFDARRSAAPGMGRRARQPLRHQRRRPRRDHAAPTPERPIPDLFCMALLGRFEGYYPGYAARSRAAAATT